MITLFILFGLNLVQCVIGTVTTCSSVSMSVLNSLLAVGSLEVIFEVGGLLAIFKKKG